MSMQILEKEAREYINEVLPGIPSKEKPYLIREIVTYYIKYQCSMGTAFNAVTTQRKDYYSQWED